MDASRTTPEPVVSPSRRRALLVLGGTGLGLVAAACGGSNRGGRTATTTTAPASGPSTTTSTVAGTGVSAMANDATCSTIPEETAGPFPGDGSNGVNVLTEDGIVRGDITSSFGSSSTVAAGVPLTIALKVVDTANGCAPLPGAAVYLWHCDIDGNYSLYSQGVTAENYLRGVQEAGEEGTLQFTTIFPGCYSGRWPHAHFEVYPSLATATSATGKLATSQLALPQDVCEVIYATSGYASSRQNLSRISLQTDNVFRDGVSLQTPTVAGDVQGGYVATLTVPV